MWRAVMRIALVKPEKARQVEEMMLQMAKRGQIGDRVRAPPPLLGTQSLLQKAHRAKKGAI